MDGIIEAIVSLPQHLSGALSGHPQGSLLPVDKLLDSAAENNNGIVELMII